MIFSIRRPYVRLSNFEHKILTSSQEPSGTILLSLAMIEIL